MEEPIGQFVAKIHTQNTGGGCMVDLVVLNDGRAIGLNDECVVLYSSQDAFFNGEDAPDGALGMFWRPQCEAAECVENPILGAYIDKFHKEHTVDFIELDTGEAIGIDAETICLYRSVQDLFQGNPDCVVASISLI